MLLTDWKLAQKIPAVYLLTNLNNGKEYVGLSINLRDRLKAHHNMRDRSNSAIHKAIAKHGPGSFSVSVLHTPLAEQLNDLEVAEIASRGCLAPRGYSLCLGGKGSFGYKHSAECREAQSVRSRGLPKPAGFGLMIAEANRKRWANPEARQAHSVKFSGRVVTEATRAKIAKSRVGLISTKRRPVSVDILGVTKVFEKVGDAAAFLQCTDACVIRWITKGTPVDQFSVVDGSLHRRSGRASRYAKLEPNAVVYID